MGHQISEPLADEPDTAREGEAELLCDALNSALEQVDGAPVRRELLAY